MSFVRRAFCTLAIVICASAPAFAQSFSATSTKMLHTSMGPNGWEKFPLDATSMRIWSETGDKYYLRLGACRFEFGDELTSADGDIHYFLAELGAGVAAAWHRHGEKAEVTYIGTLESPSRIRVHEEPYPDLRCNDKALHLVILISGTRGRFGLIVHQLSQGTQTRDWLFAASRNFEDVYFQLGQHGYGGPLLADAFTPEQERFLTKSAAAIGVEILRAMIRHSGKR